MTALKYPFTVFKSQRNMDDYDASDMRCGDLSEADLKRKFHLVDVSARANPYTLTKITPFNQPQSRFYGMHGQGKKITKKECIRILFDELRHLSQPFAASGPYKILIEKMIAHMHDNKGTAFSSQYLNLALKEQINNDNSKENSSRLLLKKVFDYYIDWKNGCYPDNKKDELVKAITFCKLPKFDRFQDNYNGMGITVHDTWATHITIKSLKFDRDSYSAIVHYKIQDHFGLDSDDILKFKFNQFRFFRIWFVLQRYEQFAFKPFVTNMEATIEITGERKNDNK